MALRDAVQHAASTERDFRKKEAIKRSNARLRAMIAVLVPLMALSAYTWVAKPAFLWGPSPAPVPLVEQEANLRMTLFLLGMRLDSYREEQGFYPASLDALGEGVPGVTYSLVSDSVFELRGVVARREVVLRSDMSAEEYLGNTKAIISNRGKR